MKLQTVTILFVLSLFGIAALTVLGGYLMYKGGEKFALYMEAERLHNQAQDEDIRVLYDNSMVMFTSIQSLQENVAALHLIQEQRMKPIEVSR